MRLIVFAFLFLCSTSAFSFEVAITVNTAPKLDKGLTEDDINKMMTTFINVLKKHKVPRPRGFFYGVWIDPFAEPKLHLPKQVKRWLDAGFRLGNSGYTEQSIEWVTIEEYFANIKRAEPYLKKITTDDLSWKWFRPPYQTFGNDMKKREEIRSFIKKNFYKVIPVLHNAFDHRLVRSFETCTEKKDLKQLRALKDMFLKKNMEVLQANRKQMKNYSKKEAPHIISISLTPFTADVLDEFLTTLKKAGAVFIPASEAIKDPLYRAPELLRDRFPPDLKTFDSIKLLCRDK